MIFTNTIIEDIYTNTKALLPDVTMSLEDLQEEIKMFELTMAQVKKHPWQDSSIKDVKLDQSSPLYEKIQTSYVGSDPEEDYKEVIVWRIADMLYVTAAVDHDPTIVLKWDVVVFN